MAYANTSQPVQPVPGQSVNSVTGGGTEGENLFGGGGISGPSGTAYSGVLTGYNQGAQQYGANAQNYTQQGPQIQNQYAPALMGQYSNTQSNLGNIGSLEMQTANGQGPALAAQRAAMTQATSQNVAAQLGVARSATGGALAQNAAGLAAQGNVANTLGNAAAQSVQQQAASQQAAAQAAGNVYGTQGGLQQQTLGTTAQTAYQQATLQQQNQQQINQMTQAYIQAQQNEQTGALNALNGYSSALSGTATAGAAASPNPITSIVPGLNDVGSGIAGATKFVGGS